MPELIVISLPRSGTTSIAEIFRKYGAINEYKEQEYVSLYSKYKKGFINASQVDPFILKRYLNDELIVDAASFNFMITDRLNSLYPNTKYLILRRELESWANSFIKMLYYYSNKFKQKHVNMPEWMTEYGYVYSPVFNWQTIDDIYEQKINQNVVCLLKDLASIWHEFSTFKMNSSNHVLELETHSLSSNIGKIVEFLEINYDTSLVQTHHNKAKLSGNIINQNYKEILYSL